jgi:hypothetical protein
MSPEWKLAYVGRLVLTLTLCYGVGTGDFGDQPPSLLEADAHSPGGLLRGPQRPHHAAACGGFPWLGTDRSRC